MRRLDLCSDGLAELEQRQSAAHGALAVVFAAAVGTEDREDVVAGVLQDLAAARFDDDGAAPERIVHHRADLFGVEPLAQRRRSDDVEKEDADLPELLRGGAQRVRIDRESRELGASRCLHRVDHGVAEHGALSLQGFDARLELLSHGRHGRRA